MMQIVWRASKNGGSYLALTMAALVLTGCGGTGDGGSSGTTASQVSSSSGSSSSSSSSSSSPSSTGKTATNVAPAITGSPARSANVGTRYSFEPSGSDENGDTLTFSIENKPSWATFNISTGVLAGTPQAGDVNTYLNIVISVSDGKTMVALPAFAISVTAIGNGKATLSWTAPTQNTDGTTLTNLAGYRLVYGTSEQNLSQVVQITNPSISTYVVENLGAGTWFFALKAYTQSGAESEASEIGRKTIL